MANRIVNIGPVWLCGYYVFCMAFELVTGNRSLRMCFAIGALILTIFELICGSRENFPWSKAENAAADILFPLSAFTGYAMLLGMQTADEKTLIAILFLVANALTIPIFSRSEASGMTIKSAAAVLGFLFMLMTCLSMLFCVLGIGPNYSAFSLLSPDGTRAANVLCVDEGAFGGRTYVNIVRRKGNHMPTEGGKELIDQGFCYPEDIRIHWISDDMLEFQGEKYQVS